MYSNSFSVHFTAQVCFIIFSKYTPFKDSRIPGTSTRYRVLNIGSIHLVYRQLGATGNKTAVRQKSGSSIVHRLAVRGAQQNQHLAQLHAVLTVTVTLTLAVYVHQVYTSTTAAVRLCVGWLYLVPGKLFSTNSHLRINRECPSY